MAGTRIIGVDRRPEFPAATIIELDAAGRVSGLAEAAGVALDSEGRMTYERYRAVHYSGSAATLEQKPALEEVSTEAKSLLRVSQGTRRYSSLRQLAAQRAELRRARLPYATSVYKYHERLAKLVTAPLLGLLRSARQGARLVLGLIVGFALSMLQDVASSLVTVYDAPPALVAWIPATLTAVVAGLLLWRLTARPRS
jgi:hypothetical protein